MAIPEEFILIITETLKLQLTQFESSEFTGIRTSKTPQQVTNLGDFYFGELIGALKYSLKEYFNEKYGRLFTELEWIEFDHLFIDYQDEFAKYIYN